MRIGGLRGWGAYLFSKLDNWRRGVHMKFEAETIVSSGMMIGL